MASFVEQATLRLIDESSGKVKKINRELKSLFATARKMRNMRIDLKLGNVGKGLSEVKKLNAELNKLQKPRAPVSVRINTNQARGQITRIIGELRKIPKSITTRYNITQSGQIPQPQRNQTTPRPNFVPQPRVPRIPPVQVNVAPLSTMLNGFIYRLGYAIETSIINGFKAGTSNIDIADTRLSLQQLTPAQASQAQAVASAISQEFKAISRGQALGMVAELMPILRGNETALSPVAREISQFAQLRIAVGAAADEAVDSAFQLAKAGEQMGAFTDAAGNVDLPKIDKFFDTVNRAFIQIGKEATPELVRGLTKSLRTAKFGLDERGLVTALLLAEEQGTTAGVGINQMIKQLSGERIQKKQLNRLRELGLVTTTEVDTGAVGKDRVTEVVVEGAVDDEGLRTNPLKWVMDNIIPAMRREGFDPTKPTDVSRFAGQVTSDRTATEALTAMIIRADELTKQVDRALQVDVSEQRQKGILDESILLALAEVQSQFTSVLGEAANSLSSIFIPALNATSSALQGIAAFIAGPTGEGDPTRAAAAVTGVAAVGAGGLLAGKTLLSFLNPFTTAATALTGSATALDASAAALMRAAIAQGAGGAADAALPDNKGKGFFSGVKNMFLGIAGITAMVALIEEARAKLEAEKRLPGQENAPARGTVATQVQAMIDKANETRPFKIANATLEASSVEITRQLAGVPEGLTTGQLTGDEQSIAAALKLGDLESSATRAASALNALAAEPQKTNEILNALKQAPPLAPSSLDLKPLTESSIFEDGNAALEGSASRFDAVFATGAMSLTGAGDQAGSAIQTAGSTLGPQGAIFGQQANSAINAPALGQQFGAAAAAAIAAAASNIRVNVNQQSGPNTGPTSTPVE